MEEGQSKGGSFMYEVLELCMSSSAECSEIQEKIPDECEELEESGRPKRICAAVNKKKINHENVQLLVLKQGWKGIMGTVIFCF